MRLSLRTVVVAACLSCSWAPGAAAGPVSLTITNGRVTLIARDASVRQILTEWAKVGHTHIVNLERVPGGPVSLELTDVSEATALGIILRPIGGFMAAPRAVADIRYSRFDRIVVMPVLATPATQTASAPVPQRPPGTMLPGARDRQFGVGRRPGEPVVSDDADAVGDDLDDSEADESRVPPQGRPPMMRPPGGIGGQPATQGDGTAGVDPATPRPMPMAPGMLTPGSSLARPGLISPSPRVPPKPPGDSH